MESPAVSDWTWHSAWPAPAKLNLFLHVIGRRADGYHLLQTVFRFIDRADTLRFNRATMAESYLPHRSPACPADSDLTVRAARLLQQATAVGRAPPSISTSSCRWAAGWAAARSDAATVLLALNHLWQTGLGRRQLEKLGLPLAPTCRSSSMAATPSPKASAKPSPTSTCRRKPIWS
jgi:4-diphosphocytidyl-2-C-methyl-D-erythritol kinase